jgi:hypothetical protein
MPAYFAPNAFGALDPYFGLAKALGRGRSLYGIQFAEQLPTGEFRRFESLKEMAAAMIPGLLAHRGDGPLCLIGFSFGAFLSIELAKQLVESGRSVPLVVLIVTSGPSRSSFSPMFRAGHFVRNLGPWALHAISHVRSVAIRAATDAHYRSRYRDKLKSSYQQAVRPHKFAGLGWYERLPKAHQDYVTNNDANLRRYRFEGRYRGRVLLVRGRLPASNVHPLRFDHLEDYGWAHVAGARVEVARFHDDPGTMLHRPNAAQIADAVRLAMDACDAEIADDRSTNRPT